MIFAGVGSSSFFNRAATSRMTWGKMTCLGAGDFRPDIFLFNSARRGLNGFVNAASETRERKFLSEVVSFLIFMHRVYNECT